MWSFEEARPGSRTRRLDLLGLGQISLDRVVGIERLPPPGGKARLESLHDRPGGQVATALCAAARLGLRCALWGAVGEDAAGEAALAPLHAEGIDLTGVARPAGARTREAWVLVERSGGDRTVLEKRDPALALPADALGTAALAEGRVLLVDLEHPEAAQRAAERARSAGIPVVLDADRASEAALQLVRQVDFPIVSQGFAEEFSSDASLEAALRGLVGPHTRMAVVTRGERGSLAWTPDRLLATPAPRVAVVDTTGAGDVFRGAFAWALCSGMDAERTLRVANTAAALGCTGAGAQGALPRRAALEAALEGGA